MKSHVPSGFLSSLFFVATVSTDGGKEELMPQGDQRKVQEDTGNSDIILTWGPLVGYVLAAVLVALTFSLATVILLRSRKSRASLAVTRTGPPTQRASATLRNGDNCDHATELSDIVLIASHNEVSTRF